MTIKARNLFPVPEGGPDLASYRITSSVGYSFPLFGAKTSIAESFVLNEERISMHHLFELILRRSVLIVPYSEERNILVYDYFHIFHLSMLLVW